ncbi:MAG: PH domain-containing protein [Alphaproteobacteria bacterium]|nr:PH domain-containing protein [Alphaproteobacteria bacterium]HPF45619.1 hypothetical protein [Emcibacteraceae bacterium]HRW30715.1 hypothetical protein [Emcibacteraceae bacterium]
MQYSQENFTQIQSELNKGEKLLWVGKPAQGFMLRKRDIFMIPFSLLWGGFAIFWGTAALSTGINFFSIFGLFFLIMGVYIMIGRFFYDIWRRYRTIYAITDERVIIKINNSISSTPLGRQTEIRFIPNSNQRGTIEFGPQVSFFFNSGIYTFFDLERHASNTYAGEN